MTTFDDVLSFLQTNKVTQEQWEKMYDATITFDRNMSKEDKRNQTIKDIQHLEYLYANDVEFHVWCDNVLRMVKYQEYTEDADRKYPEAVTNVEHADTPSENYYIPSLCPGKDWCEDGKGNPFLWGMFSYTLFLVRKDVDSLICNNDSGTEAFAAFWHGRFKTLLTPEFFYNSDYPNAESSSPLHNDRYNEYYKRYMTYDLTIWNFEVLDTLYKEARNDIL
jgi:hypothetical protein